ncbi:sorbosone dehydrogenase family protein [Paucibacter sp. R3-3]|uniref:Sorbosone dehydrogenase family protein n=1 Tax=Roseateles agri TaxID=3098619 RepID=A0ABU5DN45_9BURK|nr:sorbosone dehydrogenase family protein [Paucibacter sp. R3-3]MDY0747722.1 sorbosone dehydrogenase family protein [Paucibacter sp. R3-3]
MKARRPLMTIATALVPFAALAAGFDKSQQYGPDPQLPEPAHALLPQMHVPKVVGWHEGAAPKVPAGFRIDAIATGLANPRNVYALANGDLLVVESTKDAKEPLERPKRPVMDFVEARAHGGTGNAPSNRILLLRAASQGTGRTVPNVLVDHLNSPFGVVVVGDALYVADTDAILRYPFKVGDTAVGGPATKLVDLPAGPINHHWTKSLTASADGHKLYVGVGSNSNAMERGLIAETDRAAVWEVDAATGEHKIFASGLRNPNGLNFYPGSDTLWAVVNERDELGPNLVPDYMTSVKPGAFYGWPFSYWGQHVDPRVKPQQLDKVKQAIKPDYGLSSHVAPLGMAFYGGTAFPAQFQGGAFVGEHGSWNRKELNGYKVVFIRFDGGHPVGAPMDFITGFVDKDGHAMGRPVGVTVDSAGALIVADDVGNTVWRVSAVTSTAKQ